MAAQQGILNPLALASEAVQPVSIAARQIFVNETPLFARMPRRAMTSDNFKMGNDDVRGKVYNLGAAVADGAATTFTFDDVSSLQVGDVLESSAAGFQRIEVVADPTITNTTTGAGTVVVRRGVSGTTAAAIADNVDMYLIGNSRTGAEVDQTAYRVPPTYLTQYVQTFQYPVQVGGKTNAIDAIVLPAGATSVFGQERASKLRTMVREVENTIYYGIGEYNVGAGRTKMKGLRELTPTANKTTAPTNAAAYKPTDLVRDTLAKVLAAGGRPGYYLVSMDWVGGLLTWGQQAQRLDAGGNRWGTPIDLLSFSFMPALPVIPSFQLRSGTVALLPDDAFVGYLRPESWLQRGIRGDAVEGDWIGDFTIGMSNVNHMAWVEGITGFAAPA
jgi:hypothetical protein